MSSRSKIEAQNVSISEPQHVLSFLESLGIDPAELELLAIETGRQKQIPKKITPAKLIAALCEESVDGTPSYSELASAIDETDQKTPSKQAIDERMNDSCLEMIKAILQLAIAKRISTEAIKNDQNIFSSHERVLVQDSTIVMLPGWLFDDFSGVANGPEPSVQR